MAFISSTSVLRLQRATRKFHAVQRCRVRAMTSGAETTLAEESNDSLLKRKGYRSGDSVILFDGVCAMCSSGVDAVMRIDSKNQFKFAALQSETGKALAEKFNCPSDFSTMVFIEEDKAYVRSDAMLRIGRRLGFLFALPSELALLLVPKGARDYLYTDVIAKYRYDVFGKRDECRIPNEEERSKFLD